MLTAKRTVFMAMCLSLVAAGCGGGPTAPSDGGGTTIAGTVNVTGGAAAAPGAAVTGLTVSIVGTNRSTTVESGYFQLADVPSGTVRLLFKDAIVNATAELTNVGGEALIEITVQVSASTATILNEARTDHRVSLCHKADSRYHMITVSQSAEPAHRGHGDAKVGEQVPGDTTKTFDENCQPTGPSVRIEKSTNGEDADNAPGPTIVVGDPVTWAYEVTNTGTLPLTSIVVTDDQSVAVSCPATSLNPGQSMVCTGAGVATLGQYSNLGTVTASSSAGQVSDTDASHYLGVDTVEEEDGPKVTLCHRTGAGFYVKITVSVNAEPAHRAHGDAKPGEPVPGQAGKTFGANCGVN